MADGLIKDLYMRELEIFRLPGIYRDDLAVKGFTFGKGDQSACVVGPLRGNEIQQLYVCSQLVKALKELENNDCITTGKQIMVIPVVNHSSMNIGKRFFGVTNTDINRCFPGNDYADTASRIADGVFSAIKDYTYGIQLASFYMNGEFVPHIRMMDNGFQSTSLANLFGMPYIVVRKPTPIDTKTLSYNWPGQTTAAFSLYTNRNDTIDEASARQAVSAILRFLTRMGIIHYESHSGYISHTIMEEDLTSVNSMSAGIFKSLVSTGADVRYNTPMAEIIDPYTGVVKETIMAPTDGIVFFSHTSPLIDEGQVAYRLIHRLHE